jgi:hypothetical protein
MPDNLRNDLLDILEAVTESQLRTIRKLRQPRARDSKLGELDKRKRMSHVDIVHDILVDAQRPLHISEILELASKRFDVELDRESVVSALAKRVARRDRFTRPAPNTFALLSEK